MPEVFNRVEIRAFMGYLPPVDVVFLGELAVPGHVSSSIVKCTRYIRHLRKVVLRVIELLQNTN